MCRVAQVRGKVNGVRVRDRVRVRVRATHRIRIMVRVWGEVSCVIVRIRVHRIRDEVRSEGEVSGAWNGVTKVLRWAAAMRIAPHCLMKAHGQR